MDKISGLWSKLPKVLKQMLSLIALTVLLFMLFCFWFYSKAWGTVIGEQAGQVVGAAVGSFNGITHGIQDGHADGREAGLSAEDTTVEVLKKVQSGGALEVLEANFKSKVFLQSGEQYAALFSENGKIVFTVNLESVNASMKSDNMLLITIPKPHAELRMDESTCKQIAVYQKNKWTGSAQAGIQMIDNARKEFAKKSAAEINSYDVLMENAIESAKGAVQDLAESVYVGKYIPEIEVQCI